MTQKTVKTSVPKFKKNPNAFAVRPQITAVQKKLD